MEIYTRFEYRKNWKREMGYSSVSSSKIRWTEIDLLGINLAESKNRAERDEHIQIGRQEWFISQQENKIVNHRTRAQLIYKFAHAWSNISRVLRVLHAVDFGSLTHFICTLSSCPFLLSAGVIYEAKFKNSFSSLSVYIVYFITFSFLATFFG